MRLLGDIGDQTSDDDEPVLPKSPGYNRNASNVQPSSATNASINLINTGQEGDGTNPFLQSTQQPPVSSPAAGYCHGSMLQPESVARQNNSGSNDGSLQEGLQVRGKLIVYIPSSITTIRQLQ